MTSRIVLLTAPECVAIVAPVLEEAGAHVEIAITRTDLDRAACTLPARLVSFGAGVIVPKAHLKAFSGAYNFHPGPPTLPGLYPSVHALYAGHTTFGVTLHEMAPSIDSGAIVAVEQFPIPQPCDRLTLDTLTLPVMVEMVRRHAAALADLSRPLPGTDISWTGPLRTAADFAALCDVPETADATEFQHRLRAVGEGPNHALTITRYGRKFRLLSAQSTVVRGGQVV